MRTFRYLAILNLGWGALSAAATILAAVGGLFLNETPATVAAIFLLAFSALIGFVLIKAAITYLRGPSLKTALTIATNTAVIIWFLLSALAHLVPWDRPIFLVVSAAVAYSIYRFVLKRAALSAFGISANAA